LALRDSLRSKGKMNWRCCLSWPRIDGSDYQHLYADAEATLARLTPSRHPARLVSDGVGDQCAQSCRHDGHADAVRAGFTGSVSSHLA